MIPYLCVALGSALGGMARYGFGIFASKLWGDGFPWGTVAINVIGSFVIGFFAALTLPDGPMPAHPNIRIFVMVGICGGFTTFSSFSLQTLTLARDGNWLGSASNIALSVVLCLLAVTLGNYSAARVGAMRSEATPMARTILAVLDELETARPVLAASALAAERLGGARIEALHVRHDAMEGFLPTEEVMTSQRREEIEGRAKALSAELRAVFDEWRSGRGGGADWREVTGETARVVAAEAASSDLVIVGHGSGRHSMDAKRALNVALFTVRLPLLLVPSGPAPAALGRDIAVAWKESDATGRAIEAALPLLMKAWRVDVLIGEDGRDGDGAPDDLIDTLGRARVRVGVRRFATKGRPIGEALIAEAHAAGADLLVMGAYSHSRLAEFILGGATRDVLAKADLPVLMRH